MTSRDGFISRDPAAATRPGPLSGVRLAVKDNIEVEGRSFTAGHPLFADRTGIKTASVITTLVRAGAGVAGMTHTDAGGFGVTTPAVINPRDSSLIAGGSSGGSAVAVAAGHADIGVGTDTAGSIRIPAACCGLYGFKPSYGEIPTDGCWPLAGSLDHVGFLAGRLPLLASVADRFRKAPRPDHRRPIGSLKIGIDRSASSFRSDWTHRAFDTVVTRLRAHYTIITVDLPDRDVCAATHGVITLAEASKVYESFSEAEIARLGPSARQALRAATAIPDEDIEAARRRRDAIRVTVALAFQSVDVVLTPTLAVAPPPVGARSVSAGERKMPTLLGLIHETCLFNLTGDPVVTLPVRMEDGMPFSIQIAMPFGADTDLLAAAQAIDHLLRDGDGTPTLD